jgi:hypothetical protein
MKKALVPLTLVVVFLTGNSLNWLKGEQPRKTFPRPTIQEICASEAALRHKHCQPNHWRSMFLQQH